jgi:hypothetical protein
MLAKGVFKMPPHENGTTPRGEILKRLLQNPLRGYTVEELAEWWLMTRKVIETAEEIKGALRGLCEEEFVLAHHEEDKHISFYKINLEKMPDIRRLLDEIETGKRKP